MQTDVPQQLRRTSYGVGIRHLQMACIFLAMAVLFVGRGCMSVAVLAMTDRTRANDTNITIYDWDKKTQSLILSSFFWGSIVTQIPGGILSNRFGGKLIIFSSLMINGVLSLSIPMLVDLGGWIVVCVARLGMGLAQGIIFPCSHTLLGQWLPVHERTMFTGIVYGGYQLGSILSMWISGALAATALGWRLIYYAVGGLSLAAAAAWHLLAASSPRDHRLITDRERKFIEESLNVSKVKVKIATPWKHIFKNPAFWASVCSQVGMQTAFNLVFVEMPTYLEKGLGMSITKSATFSALPYIGMWVGGMASSFFSKYLLDKDILTLLTCRKIFNTLCLFGTSCCLFMLCLLSKEQQSLAVCTLVACLSCCGCSSAGYVVNFLDLSANFGGVMLGISNTIATGAAVLTPIFTGIVLKNNPSNLNRWAVVFITVAAVNVIGNIVFLIFAKTERQEWDHTDFNKKNNDLDDTQIPLNQVSK